MAKGWRQACLGSKVVVKIFKVVSHPRSEFLWKHTQMHIDYVSDTISCPLQVICIWRWEGAFIWMNLVAPSISLCPRRSEWDQASIHKSRNSHRLTSQLAKPGRFPPQHAGWWSWWEWSGNHHKYPSHQESFWFVGLRIILQLGSATKGQNIKSWVYLTVKMNI